MRKILLILFIATQFAFFAQAANRNKSEAYNIANSFLNKTSNSDLKKAKSAYSSVELVYSKARKQKTDEAYYYVFNRAENAGFVIISGDDRAQEVLGYSDENSFNNVDIPNNISRWLGIYEQEIEMLEARAKPQKIKSIETNIADFAATVAPLLGQIKWNQDAPYNNLCPIIDQSTQERAASGCVATGMAQVMKYHQWPAKGKGSNSYTTETLKIPLSLDFSKTTFDWANMTSTYSSSSTNVQNSAVATLMYNCGISVDMDYNKSSGAFSTKLAQSLIEHFDYDKNIQYYSRDFYTRIEWINLIKTELNSSRPVLYNGVSGDGGHLFVCDGYDNNGLFHINWGWGGQSNGYFQISALDPQEQGIGGSSGGYNAYQGVIAGVEKPNTNSKPSYLIHMGSAPVSSVTSTTRTGIFNITYNNIYNRGINSFTGKIGFVLFDMNNNIIEVIKEYQINDLESNYGWKELKANDLTIKSSVANGQYGLYAAYKATNESEWTKMRSNVGTVNYIVVDVKSTKIDFKKPTEIKTSLKLNNLETLGRLYNDKSGRFKLNISNTGSEYNSDIAVYLESKTDNTIKKVIDNQSINFAENETRELNFSGTIDLQLGQYNLYVLYDPTNTPNIEKPLIALGDPISVEILNAPTESPSLVLNSAISFQNNAKVDKTNAALTASVTNQSGFYSNKLVVFIFNATSNSSLAYIGYQDAFIDKNETIQYTVSTEIDLEPGDYQAIMYYLNPADQWLRIKPNNFSEVNFTLVEGPTSIKTQNKGDLISLFPNPATTEFIFKSNEKIKSYSIYNLTSELVSTIHTDFVNEQKVQIDALKSGVYILKVETENGTLVTKFVKQ